MSATGTLNIGGGPRGGTAAVGVEAHLPFSDIGTNWWLQPMVGAEGFVDISNNHIGGGVLARGTGLFIKVFGVSVGPTVAMGYQKLPGPTAPSGFAVRGGGEVGFLSVLSARAEAGGVATGEGFKPEFRLSAQFRF